MTGWQLTAGRSLRRLFLRAFQGLLCLLAVLSGAETITDIARFGEKKLDLLCRIRPFAAGTPAHDHLGEIVATLDAEAFQRCFVAWVAALIGVPEGVAAIDGKTVRWSWGATKDAFHMVSAFAARQPLAPNRVKGNYLSIGTQLGPRIGAEKGPLSREARRVAFAAAELVGVAQPRRTRWREARWFDGQARFLKRQLSLPVSTMSQ
jgi:hypothetical protein